MGPLNQASGDAASRPNDAAGQSSPYVPRASHACEMCRLKKARCNQQNPCSFCKKRSVNCVYSSHRNGQSVSRHSRDERFRTRARRKEVPGATTPVFAHSDNSELRGHQMDHWTGYDAAGLESSPQPSEHSKRRGSTEVDNGQQVDHTEGGIGPELDPDIVEDINRHTSGTEFYGMSSNFVLLNQLFSHARLHASDVNLEIASSLGMSQPSPATADGRTVYTSDPDPLAQDSRAEYVNGAAAISSHLSAGRLSIVNLLYNEEAMLPPSRPKSPIVPSVNEQTTTTKDPSQESNIRRSTITAEYSQNVSNPHPTSDQQSLEMASQRTYPTIQHRSLRNKNQMAEERLEKELVRVFFSNLHHLHPFLLVDEFNSRCEGEIWNSSPNAEPRRNRNHFLALYNIVIAVGALIATKDTLLLPGSELGGGQDNNLDKTHSAPSSIALSVKYFRKSRVLLGDVFEVCSIESAQTLFLMSLYCQNALKPHSCYMYSGMAVRTALAIGLPSESMSKSTKARKAARRTWWCIYSHEIDMCCSSGRRDSLRKPGSYLIPLPRIRDQDGISSECEDHSMAMINEMVKFAIVLRKTSKEIYHDSKGLTLREKSARALELDEELITWKGNLPYWLNLDTISFREQEWASKQKLVLQLRYLNARILLHRPFLASLASQNFAHLEANIEPCLDAARKTIEVLYESYAHRLYFRTWWYNSTYTLYAGMILLYVVLLNYDKIPGEELLRDVERSHEILLAMEEASVAQRSAALMLEVIQIAKAYLIRRRRFMQLSSTHSNHTQLRNGRGEGDRDDVADVWLNESNTWQQTLFAEDFLGVRRVDMLSTLIDPNILADFAAQSTYSARNDMLLDLGSHTDLGVWGEQGGMELA